MAIDVKIRFKVINNYIIFVSIENETTSAIGASGIKVLLEHMKTKDFK